MNKKLFLYITIATLTFFNIKVAAQNLPMKEHEMLKMDDGTWQANIKMWSTPDAEPSISSAKETNTMIGELWSIGKLEGNIAGTDFIGYATLGYDPSQKKYVGTWVDSVTPEITQMSGTYDADSKTLTLFYLTYASDGKAQERKNVMVYKNDNTRDFEMFIKRGDQWTKSMEILYQRIDTAVQKKLIE